MKGISPTFHCTLLWQYIHHVISLSLHQQMLNQTMYVSWVEMRGSFYWNQVSSIEICKLSKPGSLGLPSLWYFLIGKLVIMLMSCVSNSFLMLAVVSLNKRGSDCCYCCGGIVRHKIFIINWQLSIRTGFSFTVKWSFEKLQQQYMLSAAGDCNWLK